jgi:dTDP-4-dehydrorhamnose reductase
VLLEQLRATSLQVSPLLVSNTASVDLAALESWIPADTDLIVNALWLADPEAAKEHPDDAKRAALSLPLALGEFARDHNIAMLQLSTCYIFDGRKQTAYIASNPGQPVNQLGIWQWECEQGLRGLLTRHIILRTGWSLGRFIRKVQASTAAGIRLSLPGRCVGQPLAVTDLARVMRAIIQQLDCGAEVWGTYQYAGSEGISLYELGLAIAGLPGIPEDLHLVDEVSGWSQLEPVNTRLVCTKIRNTFGIKQVPWRVGLTDELTLLKGPDSDKPASS